MADMPLYRVEFRESGRLHVLAVDPEVKPTVRTLDPYISRLVHAGKSGEVALVDRKTGAIVAKRTVPESVQASWLNGRRRRSYRVDD